MRNKKIIYYTICLIFILSCNNKKSHESNIISNTDSLITNSKTIEKTNLENNKYKEWVYQIGDNQKKCEIGYWIDSNSIAEIGPKSLTIQGDYVYITDAENSSVKKINLLTGQIKCQNFFYADYKPILNDIIFFNNKIIISNSIDSLMIVDTTLNLVENIHIGYGEKWFVSDNEDSLKIYREYLGKRELVTLDKKFNLCKFEKSNINIFQSNSMKGVKKFRVVGQSVILDEKDTIKVNKEVPKMSDKYDAINVDWDTKYFVYWSVDREYFTLYVYLR